MTPKRLTELIIRGDREALCAELAPLDEKERASLAAHALETYRLADNWGSVFFDEPKAKDLTDPETVRLVKKMQAQNYADWRMPRWTATLALLGLCDKKTLKGPFGGWFHSDVAEMPHRVLQILDARRPGWLATWKASWSVERGLIRSGALPANDSDEHIRDMATGLHGEFGFEDAVKTDTLTGLPTSVKDALRADPGLLEHEVWRLFEVENTAFDHEGNGWIPALIELSEAGTIDRRRLLTSSVRALALPFKQYALSAYGKFHEALTPTLDEREALVADYLGLLASPMPVIVGHALDALEELAKAKRLPANEFVEACAPVFHVAKKAQPIKTIKLVKLLIKQDASCRASAAKAMIAALGHELADVQIAAIEMLESLPAETVGLQDEIRSRADGVAASLRSRLDALMKVKAKTGETKASPSKKPSPKSAADGSATFESQLAGLSADLRAAAGVDAALACVAEETEPWPTPIDPRRVPRRGAASPVVPLASLDELIEAVTAFVEKVDDVMEVERILDGISRFFSDAPADFDKRVAPLRKRIEARSEPMSGTVLDQAADLGVAQVIRRWLGMPVPTHEHFGWRYLTGIFFRMRTLRLHWRIAERRPAVPLLALPTQQDGWLDPVALVERLKIQDAAKVYVPDSIDLAQALLRLTPDGRAEALKLAADVQLYGMDIVRFALGEGNKLTAGTGGNNHEELLLAAARARLLIDDPAALELGVVVPQVRLRDDGWAHLDGPVCVDMALPGELLSRVFSPPDPNVESWGKSMFGVAPLPVVWQTLVWPADRRPACLLATLGRDHAPATLRNLPDRDTTWHDEAARLAAWAMGSDVPAAKGLVTDALIEAIGERTLDPTLLGKHLAAIAGELKSNRVAAVLAESARVSPLHQWGAFRALDTLVGRLETTPADLHHLLTVLLETAVLTGQTLSDAARGRLGSIAGAGKTTKLAKQLLNLDATPDNMKPVRAAAAAAALARAQRWVSLGSS